MNDISIPQILLLLILKENFSIWFRSFKSAVDELKNDGTRRICVFKSVQLISPFVDSRTMEKIQVYSNILRIIISRSFITDFQLVEAASLLIKNNNTVVAIDQCSGLETKQKGDNIAKKHHWNHASIIIRIRNHSVMKGDQLKSSMTLWSNNTMRERKNKQPTSQLKLK